MIFNSNGKYEIKYKCSLVVAHLTFKNKRPLWHIKGGAPAPPSNLGASCCNGGMSNIDKQCQNPATDPHRGQGCGACGISTCRLCGYSLWPPCLPPPQCCSGGQSRTDARCSSPGSDPYGGMGCAACGKQTCRFCGYQHFPPCP